MRNGFFAAIGALALGGTAAFGQASPAPAPALPAAAPPAPAASSCDLRAPAACDDGQRDGWGRVALSADYLLWWVRKGPTPGPLLTLGSTADDPFEGALGQPHTAFLFGDHGLDYHTFSGMRLNGSVGLTSTFSLDGSYFVLERRSVGTNAPSDATGNPLIARPVIDDFNGLQESYSTSFPGAIAGQTDIVSHTRLQGFDVNLAATVMRGEFGRFDLLGGYRYLNLQEDLLFNDALTPLTTDYLTFLGPSVNPPNTLTDFDSFRTRNHFNGGQLGARWQRAFGRLEVDVTGKLALGATDQRVQIDGGTTLLTPGAAPTTVPGGILAQQSNIGTFSHSTFSLVPEVGLNVGVRITENVSAHVGYTFLYWTHVVRPGDEIDPRVNPFVVPSDQRFGAGPSGGHPVFSFHDSDFWAQGINFGVSLRF
jgi:hypothetical protein